MTLGLGYKMLLCFNFMTKIKFSYLLLLTDGHGARRKKQPSLEDLGQVKREILWYYCRGPTKNLLMLSIQKIKLGNLML